MNIWLTLLGMALVTYASRVVPLLTMRSALPPLLERALRYVAPSIFAALIVPALLAPGGRIATGPELWAGLAGVGVAWATRNIALTIVAGLAIFALLR